MDLRITPEDFVAAFQRDFPREHEIVALRLVNNALRQKVGELEMVASTAEAGARHGHSHPHEEPMSTAARGKPSVEDDPHGRTQ